MDAEIQAAQERAQAAQPGEFIEEEGAEQPTAEAAAGEETGAAEGGEGNADVTPATPPAPEDDRFTRLERQLAEANDRIERLSGRDRPQQVEEPEPDTDKFTTAKEWKNYIGYKLDQVRREMGASFREDAIRVSAEQKARGIYSRDSMGEGRDYDALVGKHIAPIEKMIPAFRQVFNGQQDPATARYVLAAALEIIDRAQGDPVRGLSTLWSALDGKATTTRTLLKQVKDAAERQVGRTQMRPARAAEPRDNTAQLASDAKNLHPSEFAKKYPKLVNGF
jgi:hypothetical protein